MESEAMPERVGMAAWLLVAAVLLPLVVVGIRVAVDLGSGFHATSDNALNELVVRDIGKHPVLLGPFARGDWSHPGPLFYYVMWVPYRMFGSDSSAMLIGALVINGSALAAMVALAKRWGGLVHAWTVAVVCGVLVARGPDGFLEDPWNPFVTVLPFGAFLLTAWAATCGDRWAFPIAVVIGTFCVQTHVEYAGPVLAVLAWCVWRIIRDRHQVRTRRDGERGLTALWWGAGIGGLLWIPPILEQLTNSPGNFRSIIRYLSNPAAPRHSLFDGYRAIAAQFTLTPDWIVGLRRADPLTGQVAGLTQHPVPVLLALFGATALLSARYGPIPARRLAMVIGIPLVVGVYTSAQIIGPMFEYRLRWVWVVAGLATAFSSGWLLTVLRARLRRGAVMVATAVGTAAVIGLGVSGVANATAISPPNARTATLVTRLTKMTIARLPRRPGVVLVDPTSYHTIAYVPGMALMLERAGIRFKTRDDVAHRLSFGEHRLYRGERPRTQLVLSEGAEIRRIANIPGARELAYVRGDRARKTRATAVFQVPRSRY